MTDDAPIRLARTLVLGLAAIVVAYTLATPLARYVPIVICGLLLAVAISSVARALARRAHLPYTVSVAIVVFGTAAAFAALAAYTGPRMVDEMSNLDEAVRDGVERGRTWLRATSIGRSVDERIGHVPDALGGSPGRILGSVGSGVARGVAILGDVLIVLALGFFVSLAPGRYVEGALLLAPRDRRDRLREVLVAIGDTLRAWLAARLFLMVVIGTAFGTALAILGVPLALPIGVLTAALAFIPYVGAAVSVLPAIAVAFLESPERALHVFLVYLAIQFTETHFLDPVVESRAVDLPPALVLVGQLVSVVWFGPIGVLFATPMLVATVVAVRMLYIEDRLGETAKEPHHAGPWWSFLRRRRTA